MALNSSRRMYIVWLLFLKTSIYAAPIENIKRLRDEPDSIGKFWQVTDFHYDPKYSQTGVAKMMCHQTWLEKESLGEFGDYKCDAPWALVESAVAGMKKLEPNPDFILWTGDSVPHVEVSQLSEPQNVNMISNVTTLFLEQFKNASIFPSFGNHDPYPVNQMPFKSDKFFKDVLTTSGWSKLLNDDAAKIFETAGYYSTLLNAQIKIIALNTAIYYDLNQLVGKETDPGGQFAWLQDELKLSRSRKEKVFITGHVPPGVFGRVKGINWMSDSFNKQLISISQKYSDVIVAHIYGHEHTDGFRVLKDDKGNPVAPMFLAPAVTPWNSTLPGAGFNNPAFRLFTYDRFTGELYGYSQYYLNLPDANQKKSTTWLLEYDTKKDYGLDNLTASAMNGLAESFKAKSSANFEKYFKFNAVSSNNETCDEECKKLHICAITDIDLTAYNTCVNAKDKQEISAKKTSKVDAKDKSKEKQDNTSKVDTKDKSKEKKDLSHSEIVLSHVKRQDFFVEPVGIVGRSTTLETKHATDNGSNPHPHHSTKHPHSTKRPWHPKPLSKLMFWIIFCLAIAVVILFIVVFLLCFRQRQLHLRMSNPRYMRAPTLTTKLLQNNTNAIQYT